MQRSAEEKVKELADQNWQLRERLAELENQRKELLRENESLKGEVALLEARIARGEVSSKADPSTLPPCPWLFPGPDEQGERKEGLGGSQDWGK